MTIIVNGFLGTLLLTGGYGTVVLTEYTFDPYAATVLGISQPNPAHTRIRSLRGDDNRMTLYTISTGGRADIPIQCQLLGGAWRAVFSRPIF